MTLGLGYLTQMVLIELGILHSVLDLLKPLNHLHYLGILIYNEVTTSFFKNFLNVGGWPHPSPWWRRRMSFAQGTSARVRAEDSEKN
jgi:hypothetical protein